jgi:hypothetical protein
VVTWLVEAHPTVAMYSSLVAMARVVLLGQEMFL